LRTLVREAVRRAWRNLLRYCRGGFCIPRNTNPVLTKPKDGAGPLRKDGLGPDDHADSSQLISYIHSMKRILREIQEEAVESMGQDKLRSRVPIPSFHK
jgi:hypothetical protein